MIVALAFCGALGLLLFSPSAGCNSRSARSRFDTARAIADFDPDGIVVTDRELRVLYANEAYRSLSGGDLGSELKPVERLFAGSPDISESDLPAVAGVQGGQERGRGPPSRPVA